MCEVVQKVASEVASREECGYGELHRKRLPLILSTEEMMQVELATRRRLRSHRHARRTTVGTGPPAHRCGVRNVRRVRDQRHIHVTQMRDCTRSPRETPSVPRKRCRAHYPTTRQLQLLTPLAPLITAIGSITYSTHYVIVALFGLSIVGNKEPVVGSRFLGLAIVPWQ